MITCHSCGLSSANDIGGKCPVCWTDITIQKNTYRKKQCMKCKEEKTSMILLIYLAILMNVAIIVYLVTKRMKKK